MENTQTKNRIRKILSVAALLLVVGIVFGLFTGCEYNRKHFKSYVAEISIGDTQEEVKSIMGTPYNISVSGLEWTYYDDDYLSYKRERQEYVNTIDEYIAGKHYIKALRKYLRLKKFDKKNRENSYSQAIITFSPTFSSNGRPTSYQVTRIFYNSNINGNAQKTISKTNVVMSEEFSYYCDARTGQNDSQYFLVDAASPCSLIRYEDGSYRYDRLGDYTLTPTINGYMTLEWKLDGTTYATTVTVPSIGTIESYGCWHGESDVETLFLPEGVLSLNETSLKRCPSLRKIVLPQTLTRIRADIQQDCPHLTVTVQDKGTYLGNWLLKIDPSATKCTVRSGTVGIAEGALDGADELQSIQLPASMRYASTQTFAAHPHLTEERKGVLYVGDFALTDWEDDTDAQ